MSQSQNRIFVVGCDIKSKFQARLPMVSTRLVLHDACMKLNHDINDPQFSVSIGENFPDQADL